MIPNYTKVNLNQDKNVEDDNWKNFHNFSKIEILFQPSLYIHKYMFHNHINLPHIEYKIHSFPIKEFN